MCTGRQKKAKRGEGNKAQRQNLHTAHMAEPITKQMTPNVGHLCFDDGPIKRTQKVTVLPSPLFHQPPNPDPTPQPFLVPSIHSYTAHSVLTILFIYFILSYFSSFFLSFLSFSSFSSSSSSFLHKIPRRNPQ